jgi:hypothetical protein
MQLSTSPARGNEAAKDSRNEQKHLAQRRKGAEAEKKIMIRWPDEPIIPA